MTNENVATEPNIIFESESLLVLDKPAMLVVHSDGRTEEPSLVEWISARYPDLKDVGGLHTLDSGRYVERYGIVHRLDRETSGVIIVAKNAETFFFLQRQFIERTNEKHYRAFVSGTLDEGEGSIELPIGRSRSDFRQWATGADARGTLRKALTQYRVLGSTSLYSYLDLSPKTGRTHQLRVHMKAIGHPILADRRYGAPCSLGFERVALHAYSISIALPDGERKTFIAPLPKDFLHAIESLGISPNE